MKKNERQLLYVSAVFGIAIITLTYVVATKDLTALDAAISDWFASWWIGGLTPIIRAFTFLADNKVFFLLMGCTLAILAYKKLYYYAFLLATSAGGGVAITYAMKLTIARERPGEVLYMNIWGLFTDVVSFSFPSGHALKGTLLFGVLVYTFYKQLQNKRLRSYIIAFLVITIIIIGTGQVIRDRHFASDVIGGYLVAITWLTFCVAINRSIFNFFVRKLPRTLQEKLELN